MFLVRLDDVSLAFGPRKLLRGAELSIEPAERVCLVGRNGAGKTSVLRLVTGTQEPDEGEVRRHGDLCITELEQVLPGDEDQKVGDFVAEGLADIIQMTNQYREQAGADLDAAGLKALQDLHSHIDAHGGWHPQQQVESICTEMGLDPEQPLKALSGGWRRRAALARCTGTKEAQQAALDGLITASERQLSGELLAGSLVHQGTQGLPAGPGLNLIRLDNQLNAPQLPLVAPALLRPASLGYEARLIDARSPSPWSGDPTAPLALDRLPEGPVLLQLLVRGNPFRGSAGGDEPWPQVVRQLLAAGRLAGLAVYGSPYLWQALETLLPPELPAAYSPAQMPQAQALLLEALGLPEAALEGGFTD